MTKLITHPLIFAFAVLPALGAGSELELKKGQYSLNLQTSDIGFNRDYSSSLVSVGSEQVTVDNVSTTVNGQLFGRYAFTDRWISGLYVRGYHTQLKSEFEYNTQLFTREENQTRFTFEPSIEWFFTPAWSVYHSVFFNLDGPKKVTDYDDKTSTEVSEAQTLAALVAVNYTTDLSPFLMAKTTLASGLREQQWQVDEEAKRLRYWRVAAKTEFFSFIKDNFSVDTSVSLAYNQPFEGSTNGAALTKHDLGKGSAAFGINLGFTYFFR